MTTTTRPKAQVFNTRFPLLSGGRDNTRVARTGQMIVTGKVYAEGGENALHTHTREDHMFFILDGQATFHDEEGAETVLGRHEGVLLPAGAYYWFQSTGSSNLVMLRIGCRAEPPEELVVAAGEGTRIGIDGHALPGSDPRNKKTPPVFTGKVFGE